MEKKKFSMKENICNEHNKKIIAADISPNFKGEKRIVCKICLETLREKMEISGLDSVKSIIENKLQINREKLYKRINDNITKFNELKEKCESFRQNMLTKLNTIEQILNVWDTYFASMKDKILEYSLIDEVQQIGKNEESKYEKELINQIILNKQSFEKKLSAQFSKESDYNDLQLILKEVVNIDYSGCYNQQKKKIIIREQKININKIGDLKEQKEQCRAVAFNNQGSIMISTLDSFIKVWEFKDGHLKLMQTLKGHENFVQYLFFLKLKNNFISSSDQTIKTWFFNSQWSCQQTICLNNFSFTCISTDLKEEQIFFGSTDNSIQVWQFNEQDQLSKKYDLKKHDRLVSSLSLNELETILVSCAKDSAISGVQGQEQIIVWEKIQSQQNRFQFKHFVTQVFKINRPQLKFIDEDRFILISENYHSAFLFQDLEGQITQFVDLVFQDQPQRLFPILYNKDKQLLYFKLQSFIYILNSKLELQSFLRSNGIKVQGAVTNDGKYLVFWDEKHQGYQTFQISYP
ncbi:unnamed protein product (macronuclear) [Paramecium tetraurelia]|uniref:Uncharacterized protein n=1 Tax=Paramecium tetraurelia TaxID=5888 RepID=A0C5L4_PARTE|nr:uncharacterized protein GSPATT00035210001 [Paramecium tetraurelia]CAK66081.1 unnamed protein product [Paramecium tetraurelia]|eukprot:XP_001433478.1 hypothetical protein (macronuclear) [Paramecium tetraurelia strain d4-2]